MNFDVKGIVLKKIDYSDNQKYLDILTFKNGILNVKLRIYGQVTKNIFSNICVSGYYYFNLYSGRYGIVVDYVEEIEQFFKIRFNPLKFALSQYFCELCYVLTLPLKDSAKSLSLILNSIWLLQNEKFSCEFLKCVFELKLLSLSGYMLNLVGCRFCCCYEKKTMFFSLYGGFLICEDCLKKRIVNEKLVKLTKAVLYAMRFIIYKEDKKIFNFSLDKAQLKFLSKLVEKITLIVVEKELNTHKIYKELFKEFEI